jgi:hypothetical protein
MLNVLFPLCENTTTTMSLVKTIYFDLTKSKLCTDKGSILVLVELMVFVKYSLHRNSANRATQ